MFLFKVEKEEYSATAMDKNLRLFYIANHDLIEIDNSGVHSNFVRSELYLS